jgi:hypothetical protein
MVSWTDVADRAGVTADEFGAHFPSLTACAVNALDESAESCLAACIVASRRVLPYRQRFRQITNAVATWAQAQPAMARMLFVVPEESGEVELCRRVAATVPRFIALFESMMALRLPAGATQTEFVISLFCRMARQALTNPGEAELAALPDRAQALALFVDPR